jgi:hypothetical protein
MVLLMTRGAGSLPGISVVLAQQMKEVGGFQFDRVISLTRFVNQKRERDPGFFPEFLGVDRVAETDGGESRTLVPELVFVGAQLRDVLTAKNSSVMAQKDDGGGLFVPQRAQPYLPAIAVRKRYEGQPATV